MWKCGLKKRKGGVVTIHRSVPDRISSAESDYSIITQAQEGSCCVFTTTESLDDEVKMPSSKANQVPRALYSACSLPFDISYS